MDGGATRNFAFALLAAGEICVTAQYRDGFRVKWENGDASGAAAVLHLCEVKEMPETFDVLAGWSFESVSNSSGRIDTNINARFSTDWPGLDGELISIAEKTNGLIQVGTTSSRGWLYINEIPDGATDIIISARIRNANQGSKRLNIYNLDSSGATNGLSQIYLTDEVRPYVAPATNAASIAITTNVKAYPPQIADIRLIGGYSQACIVTNSLDYVNVGLRRQWTFRGLMPGDYVWRVGWRSESGAPVEYSPYSPVTLSPDSPSVPGFAISIR